MTKQEKALEVIERLRKEYPDAGCTLDYDDAWKLLVSVRLAAQCTDARVNVVVEDLYAKYPDVNALAEAPVEEVEKIVRPCGLGKSKARDICACMKILKEEYQGKVPDDFQALLKLPGVGRKTANVIRGNIFHEPSVVVDTHVKRISKRLGFTKEEDPEKIEQDLMKVLPKEHWILYNIQIITFGRQICFARSPKCEECFLTEYCKEYKEKQKKSRKKL